MTKVGREKSEKELPLFLFLSKEGVDDDCNSEANSEFEERERERLTS